MRIVLAIIGIVFIQLNAYSQIDTIHAGDGKLKVSFLPQGTQRYLVYLAKGDQKKGIWLWERTATKESFHGKEAIIVRQQWTSSDTGFNRRELFSAIDPVNFTPIYHTATNPKTGREAFNYSASEITTADSVSGVGKKGFRQSLNEPSYNWELDLETFPLLPLKEGKSFVINFYHPGSPSGPGWYTYKVTGSEKIASVNGSEIDCFKLYTEYPNNQGNSTWWLSKKTHEVIKMEEHYGPVTRYKIKLAASE